MYNKNIKEAMPPSAVPPSMETYRMARFKAMVARRMENGTATGIPAAQVAATVASEQRALAAAINDPAFVAIAAQALMQAQAAIHPNPRYQSTSQEAHESMAQIMRRRGAEAQQFASLIEQPQVYTPLAQITAARAEAEVPSLRDVKTHEVLHELLHLEDGKPQVIAHIDAAAKGTMLEHDALAKAFAPDGLLHAPLMEALQRALPAASREHIHALVNDWLETRRAAAQITSDLAANDGAAYREAVRQSTEFHRRPPQPPTTVVSHAAIERNKTDLEKAEDISYTINHAVSCGMTDVVLAPAISGLLGVNIGCVEHDHHHDHAHHHHHDHAHGTAKQPFSFKRFGSEALHYFKGEIIGDLIAVPLTILVQRWFPGFMHGLSKLLEPIATPFFRGGARRAAERWGAEQGLPAQSAEVKAHAEGILRHEIDHLPQAVMWNAFAFPIGVVAQKWGGHGASIPQIVRNKAIGSVVSNGLLLGGRAVAPAFAERVDAFNSRNIVMPMTKTVTSIFGGNTRSWKEQADTREPVKITER